ncbi:MAG: hypothetical protein ACI9OJ_000723 [Myxococcota bacterium]|jgi:hypothetical protein
MHVATASFGRGSDTRKVMARLPAKVRTVAPGLLAAAATRRFTQGGLVAEVGFVVVVAVGQRFAQRVVAAVGATVALADCLG